MGNTNIKEKFDPFAVPDDFMQSRESSDPAAMALADIRSGAVKPQGKKSKDKPKGRSSKTSKSRRQMARTSRRINR